MVYIKKFDTRSEYEAYDASDEYITPNVSSLNDEPGVVLYNPLEGPHVMGIFNVTDTVNPTAIIYASAISQFAEIKIDGVVQPSVVSEYTFTRTGLHTVKYTFADPTSIGNSAFQDCYVLTSINIPDSVTNIGNSAFNGCTRLTSIDIPDSVTVIGDDAFAYCRNLTSIDIPDSVTSIGNNAFQDCSNLSDITFGLGVTTIGKSAFQSCTSIVNITITDSVRSIGAECFSGCTSLVRVTVNPISVPALGDSAFDHNAAFRKIYVPDESVDAYKAAHGWSVYASDIRSQDRPKY